MDLKDGKNPMTNSGQSKVHNFESQNTVIVRSSIDYDNADGVRRFNPAGGNLRMAQSGDTNRFDSERTHKREMDEIQQKMKNSKISQSSNRKVRNAIDRQAVTSHQRKRSGLTLDMDLIEQYEPN